MLIICISATIQANNHKPGTRIFFTKENIHQFKEPVILAALAWHECRNLHWYERWLIMEATWNRVEANFNNNGSNLVKQLNAPNQFYGLYDKNFYFDVTDDIHFANLQMAKMIIAGFRFSDRNIYYWSTCNDRGKHHSFCKKDSIKTLYKTRHTFRQMTNTKGITLVELQGLIVKLIEEHGADAPVLISETMLVRGLS